MLTRWLSLPLLTLVAALFVVAGCSNENEPAQPPTTNKAPAGPIKVTLALNWLAEPEFGGFYAARESGAYGRNNLDVDIQPGGPNATAAISVAQGTVDFGIVSADEILLMRPKGADIVALFAVYQTCPQGIMTHASRGCKSIQDVFKGGTLAVEPGNAYVDFLKKKYDMSKVNIVNYDYSPVKFLNDKDFSQQCFVTSEPIAAKQKGSDPQVFLIADTGYNPYTTVIATRGEYLKQHPDIVKQFIAATRDGWRAYLDDPKGGNDVMAKINTTMDLPTFADAAAAQKPLIETAETKKDGLGIMTAARWQTLSDQLKDLGKLEKPTPIAECFKNIK